MLLQCEEAGGKNPLGPPACLRFRFLPSCRHYGSLESRNSKIPPDCHPYRSKLLYCNYIIYYTVVYCIIYSTHPKLYTTIIIGYLIILHLVAILTLSSAKQTNKKNPFYSYTWPKCYIHIFWTFPMFLLKVSLFQRDLKVGFTELIQRKSRFSFYLH